MYGSTLLSLAVSTSEQTVPGKVSIDLQSTHLSDCQRKTKHISQLWSLSVPLIFLILNLFGIECKRYENAVGGMASKGTNDVEFLLARPTVREQFKLNRISTPIGILPNVSFKSQSYNTISLFRSLDYNFEKEVETMNSGPTITTQVTKKKRQVLDSIPRNDWPSKNIINR